MVVFCQGNVEITSLFYVGSLIIFLFAKVAWVKTSRAEAAEHPDQPTEFKLFCLMIFRGAQMAGVGEGMKVQG